MFEPQDHPNDFQYPGGPPIPPYDITGWTLALQMGVQFDRLLDDFSGPFAKIDGLLPPPPASSHRTGEPGGISHQPPDQQLVQTRQLAARRQTAMCIG